MNSTVEGGPEPYATIGTQKWQRRNLDVSIYRNGDIIPYVKDQTTWNNLTTGAWCWYNNDPELGKIYGKLYNWYAVNDARGLAPEGWRIPTNTDVFSLYAAPNPPIQNAQIFNNVFTGLRLPGGFLYENTRSYYWTSLNSTGNKAYYFYYPANEYGYYQDASYITGLSVRCIKD